MIRTLALLVSRTTATARTGSQGPCSSSTPARAICFKTTSAILATLCSTPKLRHRCGFHGILTKFLWLDMSCAVIGDCLCLSCAYVLRVAYICCVTVLPFASLADRHVYTLPRSKVPRSTHRLQYGRAADLLLTDAVVVMHPE